MPHDIALDNRGLHRRLKAGAHKRWVFSPTAIFTPFPTQTDTAATSDTTTQTTSDPLAGLFPPHTSSTTSTQPTLPIVPIPPLAPTDSTTSTTSTISSTSTSTTSSSTSTSTTSTPPPPPPTSSTTSQATFIPPTQTLGDTTTEVDVTITQSSPTQSGTSLAASPTASTTASSGVSTGAIAAGIIAAVIGVAGIVFAVIYFVRRSRQNREEDADDFSPDAFRRQSMMIPDDGSVSGLSRAMTWNRGGARPPTMIEQKLANGPVSYNQPPVPPPHAYDYSGAYNQSPFSPGQIYTPTTANSANPFFSYESPIGSPVSVPPYDSRYDVQGHPVSRQPSIASTAILSRQTSYASKPLPDPVAEADYVDMNRSSVTPFQAVQYADISRRLNATPPQGLPLAAVSEELDHAYTQGANVMPPQEVQPLELQPSLSFDEDQHLTVQSTPHENSFPESPFADPVMAEEQQQRLSQRESTDSILEPPEPAFAGTANKTRIASIPPMLPEIQLQQRPFSPVTMDFPIAPSSVRPSPSPFSTSFDIPSPPPSAHFPEDAAPKPAPALREGPTARVPMAKRPDTVYTLYDDDDAYSGI